MKFWILIYDLDSHKFVKGCGGAVERNRVRPSITNRDRAYFKRVANLKGINDYKLYAIEDSLFRKISKLDNKEALKVLRGF